MTIAIAILFGEICFFAGLVTPVVMWWLCERSATNKRQLNKEGRS